MKMFSNVDKTLTSEKLKDFSKEELIQKVLTLQAHNTQLRNIIAKNTDSKNKSSEYKSNKPFDFSKCEFRHILLHFSYLGWDYHGYVVQEDTTNTIENYLFKALTKTCLIKDRTESDYHRCGRTDKGVSSFGQVISLRIRSKLPKEKQDDLANEFDYCKLLNKVLPDNIQCFRWKPINDDFSARFDCRNRTYKYFFPKYDLNIEKMRKACDYLIGTHDFRNFCKMDVGNGVTEFIRNILEISIKNTNDSDVDTNWYSMYVIAIKGKAFLWHQIRCIMAVLFIIGQEKEDPELILELLDVEKNPRKPEYNMAHETPLNLFNCAYDLDETWQYDAETLSCTLDKLNTQWTLSSVKANMIKSMIDEITILNNINNENQMKNYVLLEEKARSYIPVMKRQKCESLEDKLQRYAKRFKSGGGLTNNTQIE